MEDVGYTARAAFVTDRFMHLLGLHGKSVLPLVLGFGCNVPAILGTRIIDSPRSRLLTIILTPLVPCTARMAVITLIAAAFFGNPAIFVSIGLVIFSLIMLIITGLIMNRFVIGGENSALLMEFPLYHLPNPTNHRIGDLAKYGGIYQACRNNNFRCFFDYMDIIVCSPRGNQYQHSFRYRQIFRAGRTIDGVELANDGSTFIQFHSQGKYYRHSGDASWWTRNWIGTTVKTLLTPASALAFLVVQVLFIPCIATVAAIRHETKSWRWPLFTIAFQLIFSFSLAIIVYPNCARVINYPKC